MTKAVNRLRDYHAEIAIILGSGLNSLVVDPKKDQIVPYAEFSEIPKPTVPGHVGRFVLGEIQKTKIIFAQGRVHLYEGHAARDVTSIVRVLAEAGIKQLIVTNAAGSLNPKFKPGEWMMITDHINLTGTSPLIGSPNFIDMSAAYSPRLREKFRAAARSGTGFQPVTIDKMSMPPSDIALHEGVYAGAVGPQYETPAEVPMLQNLR